MNVFSANLLQYQKNWTTLRERENNKSHCFSKLMKNVNTHCSLEGPSIPAAQTSNEPTNIGSEGKHVLCNITVIWKNFNKMTYKLKLSSFNCLSGRPHWQVSAQDKTWRTRSRRRRGVEVSRKDLKIVYLIRTRACWLDRKVNLAES